MESKIKYLRNAIFYIQSAIDSIDLVTDNKSEQSFKAILSELRSKKRELEQLLESERKKQ